MIACIIGPPRSGTSLLAEMGSKLGVYLGTPDELAAMTGTGRDTNPNGNWEHHDFVAINREIIRSLGGGRFGINPFAYRPDWWREPGGIVFMIWPKIGALPSDAGRQPTPISEMEQAFSDDADDASRSALTRQETGGHYNAWDLQSMLDLIRHCNERHQLNWAVIEVEETDSKVGNGHTVVAKYQLERGTGSSRVS